MTLSDSLKTVCQIKSWLLHINMQRLLLFLPPSIFHRAVSKMKHRILTLLVAILLCNTTVSQAGTDVYKAPNIQLFTKYLIRGRSINELKISKLPPERAQLIYQCLFDALETPEYMSDRLQEIIAQATPEQMKLFSTVNDMLQSKDGQLLLSLIDKATDPKLSNKERVAYEAQYQKLKFAVGDIIAMDDLAYLINTTKVGPDTTNKAFANGKGNCKNLKLIKSSKGMFIQYNEPDLKKN
ncbi:MAG: hypothetical protein LWW74_06955 [Burkholderiales bacterium]|nr:hypothetical protein [Burkholderiales bacterium]